MNRGVTCFRRTSHGQSGHFVTGCYLLAGSPNKHLYPEFQSAGLFPPCWIAIPAAVPRIAAQPTLFLPSRVLASNYWNQPGVTKEFLNHSTTIQPFKPSLLPQPATNHKETSSKVPSLPYLLFHLYKPCQPRIMSPPLSQNTISLPV